MLTKWNLIVCFSVNFFILVSCKKEIKTPDEIPVPITRIDGQLLKDSIYYYYKLYSLWESNIPKYDIISRFTDSARSSQDVLSKLMALTPKYTGYSSYGGTYDRFSYFSELGDGAASASIIKMDKNDGFGLFFSLGAIDSDTAYPFIYMVEGGSPANVAGIKRSDMVLSLNDIDTKIDVDCSSGTCEPKDSQKYNAIIALLTNSLNESSMRIKLQNSEDKIESYSLNNKTYEINPLLADTVFEFTNRNVGYLAYSSFEEIENDNENQRNLDQVFDNFEKDNIKDLIVDLRYNGGGYVNAAVYFADKIINSSGKGKLMVKYELNEYLSRNKNSVGSSFKDVFFTKNNALELETVCFVVSDNTASAAEMLINVLKPYMNVKIVAEGNSTYGKPVGFFEQKIMGEIGLWVTSFKLQNANSESDYWSGIEADRKNITDYIFVNFADKEEKMIEAALTYTGAIMPVSLRAKKASGASSRGTNKIMMGAVTPIEQKGALKL